MASAPKNGRGILVTIRPSEQGAAEVDLAYWSNGDQFGAEGWRAADSSRGRIIESADARIDVLDAAAFGQSQSHLYALTLGRR
ncbi:hypothetical protein M728_005782 (plasmid) [Ensifer sp. WSM1721]